MVSIYFIVDKNGIALPHAEEDMLTQGGFVDKLTEKQAEAMVQYFGQE